MQPTLFLDKVWKSTSKSHPLGKGGEGPHRPVAHRRPEQAQRLMNYNVRELSIALKEKDEKNNERKNHFVRSSMPCNRVRLLEQGRILALVHYSLLSEAIGDYRIRSLFWPGGLAPN